MKICGKFDEKPLQLIRPVEHNRVGCFHWKTCGLLLRLFQQGLENSQSGASSLGPTPIFALIGSVLLLGRFEAAETYADLPRVIGQDVCRSQTPAI